MKTTKTPLNVTLTVIFAVCLFFLILTFSIGLPIYCRFFYFLQMDSLGVEQATGHTAIEIKEAYNQILNYLTLPNQPFGTGVFAHSEEGFLHFQDVKVLFDINVILLIVSAVVVLSFLILNRNKVITLLKPRGFFVGFYSAVVALSLILIICILVGIFYNDIFEIFHTIFFPGKDNWIFNSNFDPIINALPEQFFFNCAIFIGAGVVAFSLIIIIVSIILKKKQEKINKEKN